MCDNKNELLVITHKLLSSKISIYYLVTDYNIIIITILFIFYCCDHITSYGVYCTHSR